MSELAVQRKKQQQAKVAQKEKQRKLREARIKKGVSVPNSATNIDPSPWLDKYNKTAYIIGGGPSLMNFNWEKLKDKFVVGINRAYEVLPETQVIYFTDDDWYKQHKNGLLKHKATKVKGSLSPQRLASDKNIYQFHLTGDKGLDMTKGCLRHGRNSTYAVINMLIQWGFKKIYLLGIDMKWKKLPKGEKGNKGQNQTHFHSGHRRIDGSNLYVSLLKTYAQLPPLLKKYDVEIINVNNDTNLKTFPIKKYQEVFGDDCFKKQKV